MHIWGRNGPKKSLPEYCPQKYLIYGVSEINLAFIMWVCAKLLQSCPTLYNPMDCSPPGSSVQEILQARILEWIAISFRGFPDPGIEPICLHPLHWQVDFSPQHHLGSRHLNVILYFVDLRLVVISWASLMAQQYRICLRMQEMQETQVWSLGWEDPLEKEMATHPWILAWKMDREAWQPAVHGITESQTWLSDLALWVISHVYNGWILWKPRCIYNKNVSIKEEEIFFFLSRLFLLV